MQQISTKEYKTRYDWVGKVIHWELYKKLKFDHTIRLMVFAQTSIHLGEWDTKLSGFWDTNRSPIPRQKTRPRDNYPTTKKKKTEREPAK